MFKNRLAIVLIIFLTISVPCFSFRLIEPLSKDFKEGDSFGNFSQDTTPEIVISKEFGKYSKINVIIPGIEFKVKENLENFSVIITIPKDTALRAYDMTVILEGTETQNITGYFTVQKDLLLASINSPKNITTNAMEKTNIEIYMVNNSDADTTFLVQTDVPIYWGGSGNFTISKKSATTSLLKIIPYEAGNKKINLTITYDGKSEKSTLELNVKPTFMSNLKTPAFGISFFAPSLNPMLLFNAIISILFG